MPNQPKVIVQLRIPPDLLQRIDQAAELDHRTRSDWIRLACIKLMDDQA